MIVVPARDRSLKWQLIYFLAAVSEPTCIRGERLCVLGLFLDVVAIFMGRFTVVGHGCIDIIAQLGERTIDS